MPRRLPEVLTRTEARALIEQTNPGSLTGLRNRVALVLMLRAGLRVSEVCNLAPKDIELDDCAIHVWRGKGAKDRVVYVDPETCDLLRHWFARRPTGSRYLLATIQRAKRGAGKSEPGQRLAPRYLQALSRRLAWDAGLDKHVTPHTLRHTYATEELKDGTPIHQIQKDLGHAHLSTTAVYLHVRDGERRSRAQRRQPLGFLNGLHDNGKEANRGNPTDAEEAAAPEQEVHTEAAAGIPAIAAGGARAGIGGDGDWCI